MNELTSSSSKVWLAAHLFYAESSWDVFLKDAVDPFVSQVLSDGMAEHFFFIRYWENGPHIRLRFKGDTLILEQGLKPHIATFFQDFFVQNPSNRDTSAWEEQPSDAQFLYPNNSIQFIEYEPELERYGGPVGIAIAERQFEVSSRAVLSIIVESQVWDYEHVLGKAIQLHLGLIFSMGMSLDRAIHFYNGILRDYINTDGERNAQTSDDNLTNNSRKIMDAFGKSYSKQKFILGSYIGNLWSAFENNILFEEVWLNIWLNEMKIIGDELKNAHKELLLVNPRKVQLENNSRTNFDEDLWFILKSYVHMTNNRLGIAIYDEAFLAYIILNSLESLKNG